MDDEDDLVTQIGKAFAAEWAAQAARERVPRGPERRGPDRRAAGFKARRRNDAKLNMQARAFVLDYLRALAPDVPADSPLWTFIDGVLLGRASNPELAIFVECARQSGLPAPAPTRGRGRPHADQLSPLVPAILNANVRHEWDMLTDALKELSEARQQHFAPKNRTRRGVPKSSAYRDACLQSPAGEAVNRAGLFEEFFVKAGPTPQEMAARLIHHKSAQILTTREARARENAATAPSAERREDARARATKAAADLRRLGTWRTLLNKLRRPADGS